MTSPAITRLQIAFVAELEAVCAARASELVASALGRVGPSAKVRLKAPIQLCPAPGCINRAAPVFGMLCGEHKGTAKTTVQAWRAARRARKGR